MSFVNHCPPWKSPESQVKDTNLLGPEPYDVNFIYPIPTHLSTSRIKLVPYVPRLHTDAFLEGMKGYESLYQHLPAAMETRRDWLVYVETFCRANAGHLLFTIIDTFRQNADPQIDGRLAGVIGLMSTSPGLLTTAIGPCIVLPAFQRTYVASHAVGLVMRYALDLPTASPPGMGMRRIGWSAGPDNKASLKLAERLAFKYEGLLRWTYPMPGVEDYPKAGKRPREGDPLYEQLGRDTVVYGMCWDDWEARGRELVNGALARV
ncbi:hypothetical protein HYDPIDRAFT_107345 [Hydnomerulius pinastri MD-312]|nr:hypothetical protein HYDPIDRAFT_107345 [Hydnomerulius pinastri MD-312]